MDTESEIGDTDAIVMEKEFIDRVLPTIPTMVLIAEVMRRLGERTTNAAIAAQSRSIHFKKGDVIPAFPLALYAFPIDVARHWLLTVGAEDFEMEDMREACSSARCLFGNFNTSRVIQRLRGTGEVTVLAIGSPYHCTDKLSFSVSEENLRRKSRKVRR